MKTNLVVKGLTVSVIMGLTALVVIYLYERPSFPDTVHFETLFSEALNEEREIIVHLPESYRHHPNRHYPVMYVLDGSSQSTHTAYSAALMSRIGVMPELIVVGVPNAGRSHRERDYTPPFMRLNGERRDSPLGKGDRFLAFLKERTDRRGNRNFQPS